MRDFCKGAIIKSSTRKHLAALRNGFSHQSTLLQFSTHVLAFTRVYATQRGVFCELGKNTVLSHMREHLKLLIGLCLSSFLTSFMGSSLNVAMPFIAQDYNCSPENVTWMINAFTATSAAFLLASSALANRFGYLKIFLVGAAISAVLSVGVALSPDLLSGSIIRALQGISLSLIFCTAMALISQRIPREHRAFAIAYNIASVYAGL